MAESSSIATVVVSCMKDFAITTEVETHVHSPQIHSSQPPHNLPHPSPISMSSTHALSPVTPPGFQFSAPPPLHPPLFNGSGFTTWPTATPSLPYGPPYATPYHLLQSAYPQFSAPQIGSALGYPHYPATQYPFLHQN